MRSAQTRGGGIKCGKKQLGDEGRTLGPLGVFICRIERDFWADVTQQQQLVHTVDRLFCVDKVLNFTYVYDRQSVLRVVSSSKENKDR